MTLSILLAAAIGAGICAITAQHFYQAGKTFGWALYDAQLRKLGVHVTITKDKTTVTIDKELLDKVN